MTTIGVAYKYCNCGDGGESRRQNRSCPQLDQNGHGMWRFSCRVPGADGRSLQIRRGGFPSKAAACRARDELLAQGPQGQASGRWTVEHWLRHWISASTRIRPTTHRSYEGHIDLYLVPQLGTHRLDKLSRREIDQAFTAIAQQRNRYNQPLSNTTLHRIRATLRAAFNSAIRDGLIKINPVSCLELPPTTRSHAVVWTDARVQNWSRDGARSSVSVWTADQLAVFLEYVLSDRLHALWHLYAFRGLRRGEALGLRWCDVDLDARQLLVTQSRIETGSQIITSPPKSAASCRTIALDPYTVAALREHHDRQRSERTAAARDWTETGYVFTRPNGLPLRPSYATHRFRRLRNEAGLPPDPPARPPPRRGQPRPLRRRGPQNHPGPTRPREHHAHRRHLHKCPATRAIRRGHRHRNPRHGRSPAPARPGHPGRPNRHGRPAAPTSTGQQTQPGALTRRGPPAQRLIDRPWARAPRPARTPPA